MPDTDPVDQPADEPHLDEVLDAEVVSADEVHPGTPTVDVTAGPVATPPMDTGYTAAGVPTFDSVREKIEGRFGTAMGAAELAAETPEGRSADEQYEARQKAAADRLAQIRASMKSADDS
ncbi:PspA/IM30 family protein [Mycolicibacterium sediminis]|uniref:PspA/IM30 family protein n=1 Tax=Mycolicibacterium sediminis TaxID=1286180 RepID=UPI001575DB14